MLEMTFAAELGVTAAGSGGGIGIYGPRKIFYKANMAIDGALNFAPRWMSNFRPYARGI